MMARQAQDKLVNVHLDQGLAYVCMDVHGERVNTLSSPVIDRFEEIFAVLEQDKTIEGVIIYSGKDDNFIAGFDIEELQRFEGDPVGLAALVARGQKLMTRMENLRVPIVAAIHGTCLGGGLEVALACHGRIATDHPATRLGLPEIMLGLIPGGGGTVRLPRIVDLPVALDMILTGKELSAKKARNQGLVDDVVHPGILLQVAVEHVRRLAAEPQRDGRLSAFSDPVKLAARTPARRLVFNRAREQAMDKTRGHYPAPLRALEVIETSFTDGFEAGLEAEGRAFVDLVGTDVAHNLMNIFFMRQEVNKDPVVPKRTEPYEVRKIGVLGAGLMGAGIAQVAVYNGYDVRLKDKNEQGLGWGLNYIKDQFDRLAERRKITEAYADIYMGRVSGTTSYAGFKSCDLVIEAVYESLELKQQVIADLEELGSAQQVIASNTSTIPIRAIAEHAKNPQNILGMHFFSPVHKMPLLEIIRTEQTTNRAIATALEVGRKMGKTCIVVDDGPGFFTSRVIGAYINEAGWILQEGARIEDIDEAMLAFGFPVGPMKLVDEVGLDVALKAAGVLAHAFEDRWDAPDALAAIAREGRQGRKNKKGFYQYEGKSRLVDPTVYDLIPLGRERHAVDLELVQQRCWLAMLNECAYTLEEGIAKHPRDVDIGVIFGLGFPPFRGGILRYADQVGLGRVVDQMNALADKFGERLRPAKLLVDKAKKGQSFY
jgi:3-hydroxyacyl-CoA dehydrogenase / enoyl-CoA hydratase / 3-hydroxybutyryl-CoA epimerase